MVGIIILNYNNSSQTLACLETLYAHCKGGNYKICVVDNVRGHSKTFDIKVLRFEDLS